MSEMPPATKEKFADQWDKVKISKKEAKMKGTK